MANGIRCREVVIDTVEACVVVVDCNRESPDDDQESRTDQVECTHKVSTDIEEPDLRNPVVGDKSEAPHKHHNKPRGPIKEYSHPASNTKDSFESELGEER